jgi:glutamyl/glutaminyl-tRNA synthetase
LGWNDGTEQEIFSIEDILQKFSFDRVQRSGANFDEQKLIWLNGQWIRKLSLDDLYARCQNYWPKSAFNHPEEYLKKVLSLAQDRLKLLSDLPGLSNYFFEEPKPDLSLITDNKQLSKIDSSQLVFLLDKTQEKLLNTNFDSPELINSALNELLVITNQKPGVLFSLIRVSTTWAPFSPSLPESLAIIGQQKTLERIQKAIRLLS